jgi:TonB family protein
MSRHLTEDQISRWFVGRSSAVEQNHIESCGACASELDHFRKTLDSFRSAVTDRADRLTTRNSAHTMRVLAEHPWTLLETPSLLVSLKQIVRDTLYPSTTTTSVPPAEVKEIWARPDWRLPRRLSLGLHLLILGLLILPAAVTGPLFSTQTLVSLYSNSVPLVLNAPPDSPSGGGGGGGRRALTPPSKGELPRSADRQLVPPMVETKNFAPDLIVESTIIAPPTETLQALNVQIGDPNGVIGPLSPGPGKGGGVGTGDGTGVGPGNGPGAGPGGGGGTGGGTTYTVGGGVSEPRLVSRTDPEYSDDARKARIEGTVELLIIIRADGTVQFDSLRKGLGFGLDQSAIDAVKKWKFLPSRRDGKPVPVYMSVFVNFSVR